MNDVAPEDLTKEDAPTIARDLLDHVEELTTPENAKWMDSVEKTCEAYLDFVNKGFEFRD